ncbi:MAG: EAL domain-containing protein [Proteobacteria bacterium]|nr:EAL domain-containing protein [Pseudomonadota bacterium]
MFRSPLKALFGFLSLTIIVGFGIYTYHTWHIARREAILQMQFINELLIQSTNEIFNYQQSILRILGDRLHEVDAENHPAQGQKLVDQILHMNPGMAGFGLAGADGQLLLVSGTTPGQKLPNLLSQPESAESFRQVLQSRRMMMGRTYYLPLLHRWVIPVRVTLEPGGKPLVMTAGLDLDSRAVTWNALQLPPGIEVRIMRPDGHWQFVKPLPDSQRPAVYNYPIMKEWQKMISDYANHQGDVEQHAYNYDDRLCFSVYLPRLEIYTIVRMPESMLWADYLQRMAIPSLIFVFFLIGGSMFYIVSMRQQRHYEAELIQQAHYDTLTGLPNRLLAMDRLGQALELARRERRSVAITYVDMDHFKRVNDSFGHMVGDKLLQQSAERLSKLLRGGDTVARLGGDEFLIILPEVNSVDAAESVANKIQLLFEKPFIIDHLEIYSACSIGISMFPADGEDTESLLKAADTALYRAKDSGRKTHCFYSEEMNLEAERHMHLESAFRHALENSELYLVYQPQVNLQSGEWTGCEALLRWNNPALGEVPPVDFIPIAEETGLIRAVGNFVLQNASQDLVAIQSALGKSFTMSINLSAWQIRQPDLPDIIQGLLQKFNLAADSLVMEITESTMVESGEQLMSIRDLGLRIALDDFGTGFCSLSYLQRFPVNTLKIDRSFIQNIDKGYGGENLVKAVINLGMSLNLQIVAEGIEDKTQFEFLKQAGCPTGQGFFFSQPVRLESILQHLSSIDTNST